MGTSTRSGEVPPLPSEHHHPPGQHLQRPRLRHSTAGGALANTVTNIADSGNTAPPPTTHSTNLPNTRNNRYHPTRTTNRPTTSQEWHARNRRPPKRRPRPAATPTTPTPTDHHDARQPPSNTYGTLAIGNTKATNTHGTIHTTTNPTNDGPRCRHLQRPDPYHHHHEPGTK